MTGFALPPRPVLPHVRWSSEDERNAAFTQAAPRIPWHEFIANSFQPQPGEHVTILGSTGKGKSNLMNNLLFKWPYTVVLGTKKQDETMERLRSMGFVVWPKWHQAPAEQWPRRIIWPRTGNLDTMVDNQVTVFKDVFNKVYAEGGRPKDRPIGWTIAIDELWWFTNMLKMEKYLRVILQHARSSGITLLGATQRPAFIPTEFYSQPTHLFFFATQDANNLEKVGDINTGNKRLIRELVSNLEQYQVLYINNITGQMARTRTPPPVDIRK